MFKSTSVYDNYSVNENVDAEAEHVDAPITDVVNKLAAKLSTEVEIVHDVSTLPNARKRDSKRMT